MIFFHIIIGLLVTFVVAACYMIMIAFTVWMMIDAGKQDRFWWVVLIIGIPFVGSAVYFFTEKKHEYAKAESHHIHDGETESQHETTPKKLAHKKKADHTEHSVVSSTEEAHTHEKHEEVALVTVAEQEHKEEKEEKKEAVTA